MKPGTRIEVHGWDINGADVWEPAKIGRYIKKTHGTLPAGYHPVTFNGGGKLLVHENRFRVIDNRAAK